MLRRFSTVSVLLSPFLCCSQPLQGNATGSAEEGEVPSICRCLCREESFVHRHVPCFTLAAISKPNLPFLVSGFEISRSAQVQVSVLPAVLFMLSQHSAAISHRRAVILDAGGENVRFDKCVGTSEDYSGFFNEVIELMNAGTMVVGFKLEGIYSSGSMSPWLPLSSCLPCVSPPALPLHQPHLDHPSDEKCRLFNRDLAQYPKFVSCVTLENLLKKWGGKYVKCQDDNYRYVSGCVPPLGLPCTRSELIYLIS